MAQRIFLSSFDIKRAVAFFSISFSNSSRFIFFPWLELFVALGLALLIRAYSHQALTLTEQPNGALLFHLPHCPAGFQYAALLLNHQYGGITFKFYCKFLSVCCHYSPHFDDISLPPN
jgi:hypothetical protein